MALSTRWRVSGGVAFVLILMTIGLRVLKYSVKNDRQIVMPTVTLKVPDTWEPFTLDTDTRQVDKIMPNICTMRGSKIGMCVPYDECGQDTYPSEHKPCNNSLKVCCPAEHLNLIKKDRPDTPKCGYRTLTDNEFIQSDGTVDEFGEYPWMVAIFRNSSYSLWKMDDYIDGGSIIHPKVIITSAHKVHNLRPMDIKCQAGKWDKQGQKRNVKSIVLHEDFNKKSAINNIGLIFLETPFEISLDTPHMGIACIGQALPTPGTKCESMGWSKKNFNNPDKNAVTLKKVELFLVSRDPCQDRLRSTKILHQFQYLLENFICVEGQEGIDTCLGDGGSPLVCRIEDGSESTRYAIFGVAWKIGCGKDGLPGVYATVADFRPWIVKTVQAEGLDASSFDYK